MAENTQSDPQPVTVLGVEFSWQLEQGLFEVGGMPVLALWLESSLAGLMQGMQRMVGTERFNLALHGGGRDSIDGDWSVISSADGFEAGFELLAGFAVTCGWGAWTLVSLDRENREAVFRTINNWEPLYRRALGVCWGSSMTGGKFAGFCSRLFEADCWATQTRFQAKDAEYDEFLVKPSDVSLEEKHSRLLASDHATRADLAVALEQLKQENAERRRAEREAQERASLIEALSTPILQVWDRVLALPILGAVPNERASQIMDHLLAEIQRTQAHYAILDVTGVEVIDTHTADHLLKVARAVQLLGARCIITGIQPAVAQTMVTLQTSFGNIVTLATLRDGIKYCMADQEA